LIAGPGLQALAAGGVRHVLAPRVLEMAEVLGVEDARHGVGHRVLGPFASAGLHAEEVVLAAHEALAYLLGPPRAPGVGVLLARDHTVPLAGAHLGQARVAALFAGG